MEMAAEIPEMNTVKSGVAIRTLTRDHLQCPVCLDTCRTKPIYQCFNGHTLCNICARQLTTCPICRSVLGRDKIRNRALETLLDHVEVSCPNRDKGCTASVVSADIKEHLMNCQFGKFIICPSLGFEDCQTELCYENLEDHMATMHKVKTLKGPCSKVKITYKDFLSTKTLKESATLVWSPLLVTAFSDAGPFIVFCELDILNGLMAKFSFVHTGQPKTIQEREQSVSQEVNNVNNPFFVELSIADLENYGIPAADIKWRGRTVTFREMNLGLGTGTFKLPLDQFFQDEVVANTLYHNTAPRANFPIPTLENQENEPPTENASIQEIVEAVVASLQPPPLAPVGPTFSDILNNENIPPFLVPMVLSAGHRGRHVRSIKRSLTVQIRFGKTLADLAEIRATNETFGFVDIANYQNPSPAANYRSSKCDSCADGPLRGIRYKCIECESLDLCYKCFANGAHAHHYLVGVRNGDQNTRLVKNFKRIYREGPGSIEEPTENLPSTSSAAAVKTKRAKKVTKKAAAALAVVSAATSSTDAPTDTVSVSSSSSSRSVPLISPAVMLPRILNRNFSANTNNDQLPIAPPC